MSDKEYIRELCKEIKSSTSKMLEQTEPSTEPPLEDDICPQMMTDPSGTEHSEATAGFEFVNLVSSNKPQKAPKKGKEKTVRPAGKAAIKSLESAQEEIRERIETIKAKLQPKKELCRKLDGVPNDSIQADKPTSSANSEESDSDHETCSMLESQNSRKTLNSGTSSQSKNGSKVDPVVQKKFVDDSEEIRQKIKQVQERLRLLSVSADPGPSNLSNPVSKTGSTSTLSSASGAKGPKERNQKESTAKRLKDSNKPHNNSSDAGSTSKSGKHSKGQKAAIKAANAENFRRKFDQNTKNKNQLPPVQITPNHFTSRPENFLLLTLLTLNPKQRDDYLIKVGKERTMLVPARQGTDKKSVEINPTLVELACELKSRAMVQCYGPQSKPVKVQEITRPFLTVQNAEKIQEPKKAREPRTFEYEVSFLLNNGKVTEKKDYKKELTLENVSKAENNSFLKEENKAALAQLVERLVADGTGYMVEGVLRVNVNNNSQAFVDDHTREADVYINSVLLRKCAMDGDYVRVFVKHGDSESGNSPPRNTEENGETVSEFERPKNNKGFVVEILEKRHSRLCVGTFMPYKQTDILFIKFSPRDFKIPPMRVYKQNWPEAVVKNEFKEIESVIYQAEIIDWHNDSPIGTILKSIGQCGVLEAENQAILVEYDLDVSPYSEAIISNLPSSPFQIPEEEIAKRTDLRDDCVFTIDPLTAKDLDDALSCKLLKNGNFEIGVHISDVSYFLKEGSELDELVKLRATSVYMVDSVYHMLPKSLCFLCSLLPGEDKLAFSVFWEITPDAKIIKTWFAKTVINSCTQLAYEHAQIMLDKPTENLNPDDFPHIFNGYSPNYLSRIVNQLQSIAVQLRARRMENGCLKINQPKLSFTLDPNTGKPTAYSIYELRTSNQMIEDFMLLANASVAEFTHSKHPNISVLRNHYAPSDIQIKQLAKVLAGHGYNFRVDSSKEIAQSLETVVAACQYRDAAQAALNVMVSKPMTRARYFCSAFASTEDEFYHYALSVPMYTHFTSPIRRYADCLVHRVLTAALELTEPPSRSPDELSKLTGICNVKKYNAKLAGDASSLLYFKHYLKKVTSLDLEAAVLDIAAHHIELVLIETGHVIKSNYKHFAKVAQCGVIEELNPKPKGTALLVPLDNKTKPAEITLFSKVRVTIQLVRDVITVTSVLPYNAEAGDKPSSSKAQ